MNNQVLKSNRINKLVSNKPKLLSNKPKLALNKPRVSNKPKLALNKPKRASKNHTTNGFNWEIFLVLVIVIVIGLLIMYLLSFQETTTLKLADAPQNVVIDKPKNIGSYATFPAKYGFDADDGATKLYYLENSARARNDLNKYVCLLKYV